MKLKVCQKADPYPRWLEGEKSLKLSPEVTSKRDIFVNQISSGIWDSGDRNNVIRSGTDAKRTSVAMLLLGMFC